MLFEKAGTSQSLRSKELYDLGILEVVFGAATFFVCLSFYPLRNIPYPIWDNFGRTTVFIVAILGCVFFLINYFFGSKTKWSHSRLILVLFVSTVGVGSLLAVFLVSIEAETSILPYFLLSGAPFFLAGYSTVTNRKWSNILQRVFCFLFASGMLFLAFISWRTTELIFTVIWSLFALPATYLAFALKDDESERLLQIGLRVLFFILLIIWIFFLVVGIPNSVNAEQRGRQKRTMGHLWVIATAVNAYAEDHKTYPPTQNINDLAKLLEPTYIKGLPREDGWHSTIEYYGIIFENNRFEGYVIRSAGRDGKFEFENPTAYKDGPVEGYERDLVFSIGSMSQWPEGDMPP